VKTSYRIRLRVLACIITVLFCMTFLASCDLTHRRSAQILAVPVPLEYAEKNTDYIRGIELAREDIAAMDMQPELIIQIDDDGGDFGRAVELAGKYINDSSVIGVVGHWYSGICVPISSVYSIGQKTLIVPTVSVPSLTSPSSEYVFRNIPADTQISKKMCDYAKSQNTEKAVIYYEDSVYGFEMSAELQRYAFSIGIDVVDRVSSAIIEDSLTLWERKWRAADYDTVFIVGNVEIGAGFINEVRGVGFSGSIICSDGMDSAALARYLSPGTSDITVSSITNSETPPQGIAQFVKRYMDRYGTSPDIWAIQGYDSAMIVAKAVSTGLKTTEELSEYLSTSDSLGSIFGPTSFDENHEIVGKSVYMKKWAGNKFEYID